MSGLSVAHRAALAALLERCPDAMLTRVAVAVAALPGGRAADLRLMLADETRDRARRAFVLGPLLPMFRARADGVEALIFPPSVLPRLWKAASAREPRLLPRLDDEDSPDAVAVADRIRQAAAAVVRDRAALIWPPEGDLAARETALVELAACLDLAHIARRGLPSLQAWLKRPDGDQVAEFRLLLKDCADIHPDGARRLLEMVFAHLDDAVLILRVVTLTSSAAGREAFLSVSELAGFVDRLIAGVDLRAVRVKSFKPGVDLAKVGPVIDDLTWCANVLAELDVTLTLEAEGPWGAAVRDARVGIAAQLTGLLRSTEKAVDRALPMTRVQIAGRMTRMVPRMTAPAHGEAVEAARGLLKLAGAVRGPASTFGCEATRRTLVETLTVYLADYADEALRMVNDGEAGDETHALRLIALAAHCLDLIGARDPARTVRRRAAVAGGLDAEPGASSQAA